MKQNTLPPPAPHHHVFLGAGHEKNEGKTWAAIGLASAMMIAEIVGGTMFGSLAVVADGLHMATHTLALLIAAMAYSYARRHAHDPRFAFGTGKLGDLAGFVSAIVLAMISLLIGYEAVSRLLSPIVIHFDEAIPIAVVGLLVNIATAWLLSGGEHGHSHGHAHGAHEDARPIDIGQGVLLVEVFEDGVPPRFRLRFKDERGPCAVPGGAAAILETERPTGQLQTFRFVDHGGYLESTDEIPEPHEFRVKIRLAHAEYDHIYETVFSEGQHGHSAHRDNNMRAAFVHVLADAVVSVLAIGGLLAGRFFDWVWMDPLMGIVGALVIANWAYGLARDTGGILLDVNPDQGLSDQIRRIVEAEGDQLLDLHLWRLGPGHQGAILQVAALEPRGPDFYRARLRHFDTLSHLTIEVNSYPRGDEA